MSEEQLNTPFDSFAWLIYKEVEKYINDNEDDYKAWVQGNKTNDSNIKEQYLKFERKKP